jgi:hypothetical protein
MAITNYTELQAAVASWAHRDVTEIVDFITLAEVRINALLDSRLAETEATLTATISSRYIALPTDFNSVYNLWLTTYQPIREIRYELPELMVTTTSEGQPQLFTIDGANIAFERPADIAYTFTLRYQNGYNIAATSTNNILSNYPDAYLFGALVESCLFSRDDPSLFEQKFQSSIERAQKSETKNKRLATFSSDISLSRHRRGNILTGDL